MKTLFLLFTSLMILACDMTETPEGFVCDKNARVNDDCALAVLDSYTQTANYADMVIRLSHAGGQVVKLEINSSIRPLGIGEFQSGAGASFWVYSLQKVNSGKITITTFDETNRLISGNYSFRGETNSSNDFFMDGYFNKVAF